MRNFSQGWRWVWRVILWFLGCSWTQILQPVPPEYWDYRHESSNAAPKLKGIILGVEKIVPQIKATVPKPADVSSILWTHVVGGKNQLLQAVLWLPHRVIPYVCAAVSDSKCTTIMKLTHGLDFKGGVCVCVCVKRAGVSVQWCTCWSQRATLRDQLSPSTFQGFQGWTQVSNLPGKSLYPLDHRSETLQSVLLRFKSTLYKHILKKLLLTCLIMNIKTKPVLTKFLINLTNRRRGRWRRLNVIGVSPTWSPVWPTA